MAKLCEVNTPDVIRHTLRSVSCIHAPQAARPNLPPMGDYCGGGLLFQLNLLTDGTIIRGWGLCFGFYGSYYFSNLNLLPGTSGRSLLTLANSWFWKWSSVILVRRWLKIQPAIEKFFQRLRCSREHKKFVLQWPQGEEVSTGFLSQIASGHLMRSHNLNSSPVLHYTTA